MEKTMKMFENFCYLLGIIIAVGVGMMSSIMVVPNDVDGSALHSRRIY
jgi:hypothetical protein